MQNVPMMANMANIGQQRQLVPLGTVNIPNLGNVPVYGVPVSINQAGQLQMGTGLGGLNLGGLNGGLNQAALNGGGLNLGGLNQAGVNTGGLNQAALNQAVQNLANALGVSSSGVTRQMSAVSVLSVVAANLWYHWGC